MERINNIPEHERTPEEVETLRVAMAAKLRKNEGDRLRRENLKKTFGKTKPPGVSVHGRPRRPLSGEGIDPYGEPVPGLPGVPLDPSAMPPGLPPPPPPVMEYPPPPPPPPVHQAPLIPDPYRPLHAMLEPSHEYYDGPPPSMNKDDNSDHEDEQQNNSNEDEANE